MLANVALSQGNPLCLQFWELPPGGRINTFLSPSLLSINFPIVCFVKAGHYSISREHLTTLISAFLKADNSQINRLGLKSRHSGFRSCDHMSSHAMEIKSLNVKREYRKREKE